ncbi:MAG TPA: DinB family protein [Terriglobia bacterium]|nr:DinB family protein [Terriglobia bacterium]
MDTSLLYVDGIFKTNTSLLKEATDDIRPEHWLLKPGDASNHLLWVAGHLINSRGGVLKALAADWSSPWGSLFARGATPAPADQYPSVEDIRNAWADVSVRLEAAVAEAPAEVLAKPAPEGRRSIDGKVGGHVAFLAYHETYHVGQVCYLRKWLGYGQTVG